MVYLCCCRSGQPEYRDSCLVFFRRELFFFFLQSRQSGSLVLFSLSSFFLFKPISFPTKQVSLDISVEGSLLDAATPGAESYGVIFDGGTLSTSTIDSFVVAVDLVRKKREKKEKGERKGERKRKKKKEKRKKKRKKKKKRKRAVDCLMFTLPETAENRFRAEFGFFPNLERFFAIFFWMISFPSHRSFFLKESCTMFFGIL